jgi:uncharacterized surface protein with fasciclin (FAS1) repeats
MKTNPEKHSSMIKAYKAIVLISFALFLTLGCEEPIERFATSDGLLIGEFFDAESETFSTFHEILVSTGTLSFLNAYGAYTCFAPDNAAFDEYIKEKGKGDITGFTEEELLDIVRYHIILDTISSSIFTDGKLQTPTMYGHYLTAQTLFEEGSVTKINKYAEVKVRDIRLINGIVHEIGSVLDPVKQSISQLIDQDPDLSIFSKALKETGLYDTLNLVPDMNSPDKRWFTVLTHTNDVYSNESISSYEELKAKYSNTGNPKNPDDSLYLYMSYHILDNSLKFVGDLVTQSSHSTFAPQEVITMRLKGDSALINEDTYRGKVEPGALIDRIASDNTASNGVYHKVAKDFNIKVRLPYPIYWDVADQPEIRKLKGIFRVPGTNNAFNLGDLSEVTWGSDNPIYYIADGSWQSEYLVYKDFLDIKLRTAVIPWIEFTTPLIVKGKYKVWICTRNVTERRAIFMVEINGETLPNIINTNITLPEDPFPTDEELELTGYKRYNYNPSDTNSYYTDLHGRFAGRLAGTIDIPSTGRYQMKLTVLNNEMGGVWIDMVHFIPVDLNQIWPRLDKDGVLIYEPEQ